MRIWINLFENNEPDTLYSDPERARAFEELAQSQRGEPEMAMLRVQNANGGGLVSYLVEHIGDLTHRMSEYPTHADFYCGYELVLPKVRRSLRMMTSAYGFEREISENDMVNARHRGQNVDDFRAILDRTLARYSLEHSRLRVYNRAQWLAREAAVELGKRNWAMVITHLSEIDSYLVNEETWVSIAALYDPHYE